jgi:hypothetical protein
VRNKQKYILYYITLVTSIKSKKKSLIMKHINTNIFHPAWVTGFIDGEGTFAVAIQRNSTMALGYQVQLQFVITQHIRDAALMVKFLEFFNCGTVVNDGPTKKQFRIRDFNKLETILFPFLDAYPLQTQKALDVNDFRLVHTMMKDKLHLTQAGLDSIRTIASGMNRGRMSEYASLRKSP